MASALESVPQAQLPTSYNALVKLALGPRQKRVFALAFAACHAYLALSLLSPRAVWHPLSLASSVAAFALAIIPLLVARKRILSKTAALPAVLAQSRASHLSDLLRDPSTWSQAGLHALAFAAIAVVQCLLITALYGADSDWAPYTWIPSHHAYYVNERFLFLVASSALLGAFYGALYRAWPASTARPILPFEVGTRSDGLGPSLRVRFARACAHRLPTAAAAGACGEAAVFIGYLLARKSFWRLVLALVGHRGITRRALVPSFRTAFPQADVVVRATALGAASFVAVETAYTLLDVYLSQPLSPLSKYTKDANRTLADGLSDPVVFFSHHAFAELAHIAASDSGRRVAIFKDVHAERSAWKALSSACLKLLEAERQHIATRGIPPKPTQPSTSTPPTASAQSVAKPQPASSQSVWDALARGQLPGEQGKTASAVAQPAQPAAAAPAPGAPAPASATPAQSVFSIASSFGRTAWSMLPQDARHAMCPPRWRFYLFEPSMRAKVLSIAGRDSARLAWSITAVKDLLQHSLTEDPFGSVQKDIRTVLRALVGLCIEMRALRIELEAQAATLDDKLAREEAAARATPTPTPTPTPRGQGASTTSVPTSTTTTTTEEQTTKEGGVSHAGAARQAQDEFGEAWGRCGAAMNEALLRTAIKGILDTFGRFNLGLEPEFEARLSTCLDGSGDQSLARWT
ncbi:uncharacterized protein PFL1_04739 [Pseudozyma flocculosa PF-1]|uniref:Nucleoporin protein Ndc1-Nup n=2 Tax=Pseudozyma flocculosa TaxID=84751 RepID=A0A5C3F4J6_9BASI|nr:uncharacterized protein PFL1_04739 [Pseudozyma flocculosa PF-1]EPQ27601.1 hypothetical protein PFL1_04739 [Pseudozyma flocculosa PF-1]SPO39272.1 uncharacterized protein PSFLO_04752 [Pseudozyma flocculosa]